MIQSLCRKIFLLVEIGYNIGYNSILVLFHIILLYFSRGVSTTVDPFWDISLDLGASDNVLPMKNNSQGRRTPVLQPSQSSQSSQGSFILYFSRCVLTLFSLILNSTVYRVTNLSYHG